MKPLIALLFMMHSYFNAFIFRVFLSWKHTCGHIMEKHSTQEETNTVHSIEYESRQAN